MKNTRNNPNCMPQVVYVIFDPETDAYMTARVSCGSGHCTYWSKDVQRARHYHDKRHAINAMIAIGYERNVKLEVRTLDN